MYLSRYSNDNNLRKISHFLFFILGTFEKCNEIELLLTQDNSTQTLINNAKRQEKRNLEKEKQRPTTTKRMFEQDQQDEQGHLQVEREILFERQELNRLNGEELNEHGGIRKRKEPELVQEDAEEAEKSKETKRPRHDQQQLKKLSDSDFYIITKTIENFL